MSKNSQIVFRVPMDDREALEAAAARDKRTLANYLRLVVSNHLHLAAKAEPAGAGPGASAQ